MNRFLDQQPEEHVPSFGFNFNYLGKWYCGSFVGNGNIRDMNPDTIIDFHSRENILDGGIWLPSITGETREALLQALFKAIDQVDGTSRINN
jgi:hypothetical protein